MGVVCCSHNVISCEREGDELISKYSYSTTVQKGQPFNFPLGVSFIKKIILIQNAYRFYRAGRIVSSLFEMGKLKVVRELEPKTLVNEGVVRNCESEKFFLKMVKEGKLQEFEESASNKSNLQSIKSYSNYNEIINKANKNNNLDLDSMILDKKGNESNIINTSISNIKENGKEYFSKEEKKNEYRNIKVDNGNGNNNEQNKENIREYKNIDQVNSRLLRNRFFLSNSELPEKNQNDDIQNQKMLKNMTINASRTDIDNLVDFNDSLETSEKKQKHKTIAIDKIEDEYFNLREIYRHMRNESTNTQNINKSKKWNRINNYSFYYPKYVVLSANLVYKGSWNCNKKFHGYGILYSFDHKSKKNKRVEGKFRNGKLCGEGRIVNSDHEIFTGTFKGDSLHGQGKYIKKDSSYYEGAFVNGLPDGLGFETFPNGSKFEGIYVEGKKKQGKILFKDGSSYTGEFANELFNGKGTYVWQKGKKYEGNWVNGIMNGKGKLTYTDGTFYDGNFKNNQRSGKGRYVWDSDKFFEGEWKNDKQHGPGTYNKNGRAYKGIWVDGKLENGAESVNSSNTKSQSGHYRLKTAENNNYSHFKSIVNANLDNKLSKTKNS